MRSYIFTAKERETIHRFLNGEIPLVEAAFPSAFINPLYTLL